MVKILNLTNQTSSYGFIKKVLNRDSNFFGKNIEQDFQISFSVFSSINDFIDTCVEEFDQIVVWYSSLNTNDSIFVAFVIQMFKEYESRIRLIDVSECRGLNGKPYYSVGCLGYGETDYIKNKGQKLNTEKVRFFEKVLCCYFERDPNSESFLMIQGRSIYELPYSEVKEYILSWIENYSYPSHTIGAVMGEEIDEKGWCFGDNVIYKFILDLINEGKILLQASFHERYDIPPKIFKNPE